MGMARGLRHLCASRLLTRRRFSAEVLQSIESATATAEARTSGELRFVVETAFDLPELWAGATARERAMQTFSDLHLWNTENRNGVLIYVLMAERDVEIVADRGAAARIPQEDWEGVCRTMEKHFRERRFAEGALAGIEAVGRLLERHFPGQEKGKERDELPNQPVLL
jgi:uncharacterized membrane protein